MGLYGEGLTVDVDMGCQKGFENLSNEIDSLLEGTPAPASPLSAATDSSPHDDEAFDELSLTPDTMDSWNLELEVPLRTQRDRCHSFDAYGLAGVEDLVMTDDKMDMDPSLATSPADAGDDTDGADAHDDDAGDLSGAQGFFAVSPTGFDALDMQDGLGNLLQLDFLDVKRAGSSSSSTTPRAFGADLKEKRFHVGPELLRPVRGVSSGLSPRASLVKPDVDAAAPVPAPRRTVPVKPEAGVRATAELARAALGTSDSALKRIGIYTPEARKARIARFHAKRAKRVWRKRIKYDCRKKLADSRPRIKGRFVRREDMDQLPKEAKKAPCLPGSKDAFAEGRPTRSWRLTSGMTKAMM